MQNNVITSNVEAWARQQQDNRMQQILNGIRALKSLRLLRKAQKGHIHRAATRAFGDGFKVLRNGRVEYQGREYTYNFQTGRFYGV